MVSLYSVLNNYFSVTLYVTISSSFSTLLMAFALTGSASIVVAYL